MLLGTIAAKSSSFRHGCGEIEKNIRGKPQKIAVSFSESAPIVPLKVSDLSLVLFTSQPIRV